MNCKVKYLILLAVSFSLFSCGTFEIPTIIDSKSGIVSTEFHDDISFSTFENNSSESVSSTFSETLDTNLKESFTQISSDSTISSYTPKEITIRFIYKEVVKENDEYIFKNMIIDSFEYTFLDNHKITEIEYNTIYESALNSLHNEVKTNYKFIGFIGSKNKFETDFIVNDSDIEFFYGFYSLVNYEINYEKKIDEKKLSLNISNYDNIGSYSTGNYANRYNNTDVNVISNCTFEHYRGLKANNGFITLLPFYHSINDKTIGGSIYNINAIENITHISIKYLTDLEDSTFRLSVGLTSNVEREYRLNSSKNFVTAEIDLENISFFKFYTESLKIDIDSIDIFYKGDILIEKMSYQTTDNESFRINPISYENELVDGVSTIDMPISIEIKNNSYIIKETKSYTYYSNSYVDLHPEIMEKAAMTEPIDIINYYLAFSKVPANFVKNINNYLKYYDNVFGNKLRQVSNVYSRNDGYVNAVPYNKNNIAYIEFDVDLDNTYFISNSKVSRGVGRVIIFETGFLNVGYDNSPVGIYTDDHYATFKEYYNNGNFSKRFNAQSRQTIYEYLTVRTLK